MRISRTVVGMFVVAGLAYAAGQADLFSGGPAALAGDDKDYQMSAEMQACIDAGIPGENHKNLNALVGKWDGEFKIYAEPGQEPMISRGTVTREWILDGRYVQETVEATSEWGTFKGLGFFGYNNVDQQYEMAWMDSMSTGIYAETGTYDPDAKVLKTKGAHRDAATGRVINTWGTVDLSSPDRQIYLGYMDGPDGKSFLSFEGITSRPRPAASR